MLCVFILRISMSVITVSVIVLCVILLHVIMLSVNMSNVNVLSVILLRAIMPGIIMLKVSTLCEAFLCVLSWVSLRIVFCKAIKQEEKQSLLRDADQIIPLLTSKAFRQTNPFCGK